MTPIGLIFSMGIIIHNNEPDMYSFKIEFHKMQGKNKLYVINVDNPVILQINAYFLIKQS